MEEPEEYGDTYESWEEFLRDFAPEDDGSDSLPDW